MSVLKSTKLFLKNLGANAFAGLKVALCGVSFSIFKQVILSWTRLIMLSSSFLRESHTDTDGVPGFTIQL